MLRWVGVGLSPGVSVGPAYVYRPAGVVAEHAAGDRDPEAELRRLHAARRSADAELAQLLSRLPSGDVADIFEAHRVLLADPLLWERLEAVVRERGADAAQAVATVQRELVAHFESMSEERFRARAADVRDVCQRLLRAVTGAPRPAGPQEPAVVVARELLPSDTVQFDRDHVLGFVTELGGPTAHVAILARALGIPAVAGVSGVVEHVRDGVTVLVDGTEGVAILSPSADEVRSRTLSATRPSQAPARGRGPATTADGRPVPLWGNAGSEREVETALGQGAEGIGLLRTEFLFLGRPHPPTEDEQFAAYRRMVELCRGLPLTVRLLDAGGDKPLPGADVGAEANPFLGLRGVRVLLRRPQLLRTQLRALLRAAAFGPVRVLVPMVACTEEMDEVRAALQRAAGELAGEGQPVAQDVFVGAMIETPAAALLADRLAADFYSLGTNDLVQYVLAVDRTNPHVTHLHQPLHPAVLRLVRHVVDEAHARGLSVSVCGEMAGDPEAALLLVGLGVDVLSMAPPSLERVRRALRAHRADELERLADQALQARTALEVQALVRDLGES